MKNKQRKKLSLAKISIAKLQNYQSIMGGVGTYGDQLDTRPEICESHPLLCDQSISTKTVGLGHTAACITGV
ncbi:hypothetical protein [Aquimarina rubra]|uniref:Bacteriocin n=1 Tax=Aquimarina rubra TaxID=1920033 RepID=A0ABW5LE96_9FLAO